VTQPDIAEVKRQHEQWLLSLPNVVSVGIGEREGKPVIQVGVIRKVHHPDLQPGDLIPTSLDGVEIDVQEVGQVFASDAVEENGF
jgi:hypothetical protein